MKKIKLYNTLILILLTAGIGWSQPNIDDVLKQYNKGNIPYISVEELKENINDVLILDAREMAEFEVSHLKNAIYVGYKGFNINDFLMKHPSKVQPVVVYCSVGVRSEEIANRLKKKGYTNVKNLYGGIFEWKNKGFSVVNPKGKQTDSIHAYSKQWSKYLHNGIKVY